MGTQGVEVVKSLQLNCECNTTADVAQSVGAITSTNQNLADLVGCGKVFLVYTTNNL